MPPPSRIDMPSVRSALPLIVLALGLTVTLVVADFMRRTTEESASRRFQYEVDDARRSIEARLDIYISLLRGAAGIFATSARVTDDDFRAYVERLRVRESYPGIQGIGFARRTPPAEREAVERAMREQLGGEFRIWPAAASSDADAFPILFLEPLDERNRRALGYDMFSEAARREAMERARDQGRAAATAAVTLVQEIDEHKQAGFLIYVPIYRSVRPPATVEERKLALRGFAYSPFRADDLFRGILPDKREPELGVDVYDGDPATGVLLHRSASGSDSQEGPLLTARREIVVAGRPWTIVASAPRAALGGRNLAPAALGVGAVVSGLLFWITLGQHRARTAAERHAASLARLQSETIESEMRKRAIVAAALDSIITIDARGTIVEFNPAAEQAFGYTRAEAIGRRIDEIVVPAELRERHRRGLARHLESGVSELLGRRIEMPAVRRDGTRFPVELAITRVDVQGAPFFTAYIRDISERREAERRLSQAHALRDKVMESAVFGLGAFDVAGRFTLVNEHFAEMLGWSVPELLGRHYSVFLPPEEHERLAPEFARVVEAGERLSRREVAIVRRDGSRGTVELSWSPVLEDGAAKGVVGTMMDVTAHKQAAAEVRRLNEELEQRVLARTAQLDATNRELEAFSYSVSHDLRAPLRHIDGFVELLQASAGARLGDEERRFLGIISGAARRMGTLIDSLLSFSRTGRAELSRGRVDMAELVADARVELHEEAIGRAIIWEVGALPVVLGDRALLRQVWINLLSNALKYTRRRETARIAITCEQQSDEAVFAVRDNGAGFDMQYAHKLFGVFQRLHFAEEFEGTGIGLANVRRIVARHGGRTWAEGRIDEGATFFFTLPRELS